MKYSIPVVAKLENNKIAIMANVGDKEETLITFKATLKNLSALGEIIKYEDLREEKQ